MKRMRKSTVKNNENWDRKRRRTSEGDDEESTGKMIAQIWQKHWKRLSHYQIWKLLDQVAEEEVIEEPVEEIVERTIETKD